MSLNRYYFHRSTPDRNHRRLSWSDCTLKIDLQGFAAYFVTDSHYISPLLHPKHHFEHRKELLFRDEVGVVGVYDSDGLIGLLRGEVDGQLH